MGLLMSSLPTKNRLPGQRLYLTLEIPAICDRKFLRFRRGPGPLCCATGRGFGLRPGLYACYVCETERRSCSVMRIAKGVGLDPAGGAYSAPLDPLAVKNRGEEQ